MPATYQLTIVNDSELGQVTVAVFALLPVDTPGGSSCVAWLAQPVNPGNAYTFGWPPTWGFAWAASGTRQARSWAASGTLPADPTAPEGCAAELTYDGDFALVPALGQPDGRTLWVGDAPTVPGPSTLPSSVAVTLAGAPAMVADAGPNLVHAFTLTPAFHITAGPYAEGQLVTPATVAGFPALDYATTTALTATLTPANTWSIAAG